MQSHSPRRRLTSPGARRLDDRFEVGGIDRLGPVCVKVVGAPELVAACYKAGLRHFMLPADLHWQSGDGLRDGMRSLLRLGPSVRSDIVVSAISYANRPELVARAFHDVIQSVPEIERIDLPVLGGTTLVDLLPRLVGCEPMVDDPTIGAKAIAAFCMDEESARFCVNNELVALAFAGYRPSIAQSQRAMFSRLRNPKSDSLLFACGTHTEPRGIGRLVSRETRRWRPQMRDYFRYALACDSLDGILCPITSSADIDAVVEAFDMGPLPIHEAEDLEDLIEIA